MDCFKEIDMYEQVSNEEQEQIYGGIIVTIAGTTIAISAAKLAGTYGVSYAIG